MELYYTQYPVINYNGKEYKKERLYMARASQVARGKEPACQCRRHKRRKFDAWVRKIPGGGHGNPLQYSCLENPMARGAWLAMGHRVAESRT